MFAAFILGIAVGGVLVACAATGFVVGQTACWVGVKIGDWITAR